MSELYDSEVEMRFLGEAVRSPTLVLESKLETNDLYIHRHRYIWEALKVLSVNGGIDLETLTFELKRVGKLNDVGGKDYLKMLDMHDLDGTLASLHERIIKAYAVRRRMLLLAGNIAKMAHDLNADVNDLGGLYNEFITIASATDGGVHWGKYLKDLYEEIEDRFQNPREIWGIPTRFSDFDFITGGLQSGESVVVSGNPGIGKSMLTFQMCTQLAETDPGAVYSLEMSGVAISRRALSSITNVKSRNLKKGTLEPDDWSEIAGGISKLDKLPIIMSDNPNWTTAALQSDLFRLKRDYGVKWFMVDYMTLLGDARSGEEYERLGDISRAIKLICRRLDLAGLLIHSMTKSGMDSAIPSLTALRGEAGVSFDADLILFLTKFIPQSDDDQSIPAGEQENMRTLIFGKGRELENPRKYIHMVKSPDYPNFKEYAQTPEVKQYADWSK